MKLHLTIFFLLVILNNAWGQDTLVNSIPDEEIYLDCFLLKDTAKYRDSVMHYTQQITLHPDSADLYGKRGYYKLGVKDLAGSIEDYRQAIKLKPTYLAAAYSLGLSYWKVKEYDLAEMYFRKALSLNPNDSDAKYSLGLLLYKLGRYKAALHYLLTSNHVGEFKTTALLTAGYCALEIEDYQTALSCFDTLLAKEEKTLHYCLKARSLGGLKRYKEANKYFALCLDRNPYYTDAWYYRGFMKYNKGDKRGACADFYIAAQKGDEDAKEMLCDECERLCQKLRSTGR